MKLEDFNSHQLSIYRTELSVQRTRLSNQRTYLAYMRTGFAIAAIAGTFKEVWVALFGILMIFGSAIQYYIFDESIKNNSQPDTYLIDAAPYIYSLLSLGSLYLNWRK